MIALDTNVPVRYLVDDDARQAEAARLLLQWLTAERPPAQAFSQFRCLSSHAPRAVGSLAHRWFLSVATGHRPADRTR